MANIAKAIRSLDDLDNLAQSQTFVHRLDPRAKAIVALAFIAMVASFDKYEIGRLVPFIAYPIALMTASAVPARLLGRYLAYACPFAVMVGAFNPLFDHQPIVCLGDLTIAGGWLSFFSIMLRFLLAVSAGLILIATTGFNNLCAALRHMGLPRLVVAQMQLLYRYIFLLAQEAQRMQRAYSARAIDGRSPTMAVYVSMASLLLLRAYGRGERVYTAMLCRGFDGEMPVMNIQRFTLASLAFMGFWLSYFAAARFLRLPHYLGEIFLRLLT